MGCWEVSRTEVVECGDFSAGQKCRVTCKVWRSGVMTSRNWPSVFSLKYGVGNGHVNLTVTG